jgi:hypothetical protein
MTAAASSLHLTFSMLSCDNSRKEESLVVTVDIFESCRRRGARIKLVVSGITLNAIIS